MELYRVIARTTGSKQPRGQETYWANEVLYCGNDRQDARIAYHNSLPQDFGGSYGNRCRETILEVISDAGTDCFEDDEIMVVED